MKLIIDIPEDIYKNVKTENCFNGYDVCKVKDSIKNGIPFEDIKVEIQNTILEQTYERGQNDALEKVKEKFEKEDMYYLLDQEVAIQIIDKYISELKET